MVYVDVHCHLDFDCFDEDREDLIKRIKENNILALSNTMNYDNYLETKNLFSNLEHIKVCPGLYPQEAEVITEKEMDDYLAFLEKEDFPALGEVGLDRKNTKDPELWKIQEYRFRQMIELGIKLDKPLIIHSRKAEERTLEILKEYVEKYNFRKFDLHCFTGKKKLIKTIQELKIYCSIPLVLLNTESFQILVEHLSVRQLLVETDSPFLNPSKERNSPLNVPLIYEKIAQMKGYNTTEIEHIIYRNYQKLFM